MTQPSGSSDVRITRRITDEGVNAKSFNELWFSYALDLERLRLDERLICVSDMDAADPRHALPTVYFHVLGGGLMYVGQSIDVQWRRIAHRKTRDWDDEYVLVPPEDMAEGMAATSWMNSVEGALIKFLKPPYNFRKWNAGPSTPHVYRHLVEHGFRLPDGVTMGKAVVPVVRGPVMQRGNPA